MSGWRVYQVDLQLKTPLHVGAATVGNIMRCRPYVPGKAIWGAVTATATMLGSQSGAHVGKNEFEFVGSMLKDWFRFGYFFPREHDGEPIIARERSDAFDFRFLETYSSTAMDGDSGSAEENSLHEVEALRPVTRGTGNAVWLQGHIWVNADHCFPRCSDDDVTFSANWNGSDINLDGLSLRDIIASAQLGGRRGYGYGRVGFPRMRLVSHQPGVQFDGEIVSLDSGSPAWAHVLAESPLVLLRGQAEPLVGREWLETVRDGAGQHIPAATICWAPGASFSGLSRFRVRWDGVWSPL